VTIEDLRKSSKSRVSWCSHRSKLLPHQEGRIIWARVWCATHFCLRKASMGGSFHRAMIEPHNYPECSNNNIPVVIAKLI